MSPYGAPAPIVPQPPLGCDHLVLTRRWPVRRGMHVFGRQGPYLIHREVPVERWYGWIYVKWNCRNVRYYNDLCGICMGSQDVVGLWVLKIFYWWNRDSCPPLWKYVYTLSLSLTIQTYNLAEMARLAGLPGGLVIGAGAGSSKVSGVNCEVRDTNCTMHNHLTCPDIRNWEGGGDIIPFKRGCSLVLDDA